MKTETQIAEENIEYATTGREKFWKRLKVEEHKASCQRFLDWIDFITDWIFIAKKLKKKIDIKKEDLKQAIKLYENNGI